MLSQYLALLTPLVDENHLTFKATFSPLVDIYNPALI